MKTRKVPLRKCLVSNLRYPKKELLRIVKTPEGTVVIDSSGKMNGRGAYIKLSHENIDLLQKSKTLERALEQNIDPELYSELKAMIKS